MNPTHPDFITHYYTDEGGPFSNLLQVVEQNPELREKISERTAIAHDRFLHPSYLPYRMETEQRLREGFRAKGGRIIDDHPVYFTLGDSSFLESRTTLRYLRKVRIPISVLDVVSMSFTYVDSMTLSYLQRTEGGAAYIQPYHADVYTYSEIQDVIRRLGYYDDRWKKGSVLHFDTYIEVQYWNSGDLMGQRQRNFLWGCR